jgi:hypothetical protein
MEREAIFPLAQFAPIGRHFSIRVFGNSVTSCNIAAQIWLFGACIIRHASKMLPVSRKRSKRVAGHSMSSRVNHPPP